jgi:hypothetical protein
MAPELPRLAVAMSGSESAGDATDAVSVCSPILLPSSQIVEA